MLSLLLEVYFNNSQAPVAYIQVNVSNEIFCVPYAQQTVPLNCQNPTREAVKMTYEYFVYNVLNSVYKSESKRDG